MSRTTRKPRKNNTARKTAKAAAKVSKRKAGRNKRSQKYEGKKLTPKQRMALMIQERKITKGLAEFVKVGLALLAIRDRKLYKSTHRRFDEYCINRWKFSVKQAYRLMAAAEIVEQLKTGKGRVSSKSLPKRENQVRPLVRLCGTRLKPLAIWKQAVKAAEGKAPSAKLVSEIVSKRLGKSGSRTSKKRGGKACLSPNAKIAKIQKLLEKSGSNAGQSKKVYEQTLMKIRKLVGTPKV